MPKWSDYKKVSQERGSLAFELFVVESTPAVAPEELQKILPDHLGYQNKMEQEGKLFLAGPMSDDTGEEMQGTGMIVYRAASMEDARAITEADPMHARGGRTYKLRKWLVNEGSLTIKVGLSTDRTELG